MLCKKYGMDTSRYNFLHTPEFFEKMETKEVRVEASTEPEMQRIQFLQEWQRYWIRIGMQLTDSQRLKKTGKTVLKM